VSEAENNNMDAISDWEKSMSTLKAQLAQKAYDMYNSDRQFNWESSMNNPQNKYMMSQIANNNIQADKWNMEKGTYGQMLQANLQKAQMENEWYPKMSQAQINNLNYHPPVGGGNGPSVGDIIKAQEYGQYQKQQSYLNGLDPSDSF
jgi:hypothetical protein